MLQPYIESFTALSDVNTMQAQIQRNSKVYLCKNNKNVIPAIKGGLDHFFFLVVWKKKIITNSYFIFYFMFICQNVGNLKSQIQI